MPVQGAVLGQTFSRATAVDDVNSDVKYALRARPPATQSDVIKLQLVDARVAVLLTVVREAPLAWNGVL